MFSFRGVNAKSLLPHSLQNFRVNGCPESLLVSAWDFKASSPCVMEKPFTLKSAPRSSSLAVLDFVLLSIRSMPQATLTR